jgi:hypothetical protein
MRSNSTSYPNTSIGCEVIAARPIGSSRICGHLENDFQGALEDTRITGIRDSPEVARGLCEIWRQTHTGRRRRSAKIRMVGYIKRLHPGIDAQPLRRLERSADCRIHIEVARSAQAVVARGTERSNRVCMVSRWINPLIKLGGTGCVGIEVHAGHHIGSVEANTGERVIHARHWIDGESRLVAKQRRNLPIAQQVGRQVIA